MYFSFCAPYIVKARAELKERVPYASFSEQKQILCAFFENISMDRQFALRFLDTNWDDFYTPHVERAWQLFQEWQSAKVIVHHFPLEFIVANQEILADDYNYLQMRLRLSPEAPLDRTRLTDSAYLYLCARQSIPVSDEEAEHILYQNTLDIIGSAYIRTTVLDFRTISSMVWSLGVLGKSEILLHFAVPSFSPSSAPIMQAFAPVVGFSLPEHQARNRLRMAADFQVFSSDRNS